MIPGGLGTDEYMLVDLNAWVTVDSTEGYSMHSTFMSSTERSSTSAAEGEAPSRRGLIVREVFGTTDPRERIR
jgi:hypothetical protein